MDDLTARLVAGTQSNIEQINNNWANTNKSKELKWHTSMTTMMRKRVKVAKKRT